MHEADGTLIQTREFTSSSGSIGTNHFSYSLTPPLVASSSSDRTYELAVKSG